MSPRTYGIDERPPLQESVLLGAQHLVAMLLGNITPPLLIAGALGLVAGETGPLLQAALFIAGISTIVQAYPIGPIGGRIPIVMGTSIAFVAACIAVGARAGLGAVFGACLVASTVEVGLGFGMGRIRGLFPPLVTSIVVMLIGLTLVPVGMDYAAGGVGATDYGSSTHVAIAALVLVVTLVLNRFGKGIAAHASVLAGVMVGYVLAAVLGMVDLSGVGRAGWLSIPRPLPYGLSFDTSAILMFAFVYVISTMETIGDITGVMAAAGRPPTTEELKGGLVADAASSGVAALFGAFPTTSYSQNVGLVNFTGVASRHVTAMAGVLLVGLGLFPKVGALFATIPPSVIGGAALVMFGMIFSSGAAIFARDVALNRRNLVILAVSIGVGLGVELRPGVLASLPESLRNFLAAGLVTGGLLALVLNVLLPGEGVEEEPAESPLGASS
ncbi:MAG: nucleobase:cation symporter-2 family protein [Candidatus Palauibacterales bacterium]|nr:nucleobase:cation symporter-2 family protein [Candidatus Palauibacterales bacterium]MDP2482539.1 nucleobase:cation symporter-2 family protein [Candidatus Palauibacterales bacterium]